MNVIVSEQLSKEVLCNNYVSILHLPQESLLLIKWKRQISLKERKDGFLWAYWFSRAQAVKNWLIDDEEIYLITRAEKEWVTNTWTKLVATSGILKIAVVIPGNFTQVMTNTDFTQAAQEQYEAFGQTRHEVFTDYAIAMDWFKEEL